MTVEQQQDEAGQENREDNTPRTAVKNSAQMVSGNRVILIPLVRKLRIVEI